MLSIDDSNKITSDVCDAVLNNENLKNNNFECIKLKELTPLQRLSMVEKHLISMDLVNNYERGTVLKSSSDDVVIMINEEDHLRLQVIYSGFKLKEAFDAASRVDDAVESKINYAYDSKYGYLTSCPTNVGTGMRASVMLHLPALTMTKTINSILNTVTQVGMTIRGLYGEGSNIMGNIYQVSNQVTLGLSEDEIINSLIAVTKKIVDQEIRTRNLILEKQAAELEDDVYRSLGILKYTRLITSSECLNLLSRVRMGTEMGIINDIEAEKFNELLTKIQPATLQISDGRELDGKDRDIARAKLIREALKQEV
jgi:protein arginine kinase